MSFASTTVIVPTFNEGRNIGRLVSDLRVLYPGVTVLVSDDGSTDGTRDAARRAGAQVVDRSCETRKGITAAVLDALSAVRTPLVVVMDGDFQHPPMKVGELVKGLREAGLVVGVRDRSALSWGVRRRVMSRVAQVLCWLRVGPFVKDPLSGFFGVRAEVFRSVPRRSFHPSCYKVLFSILKYYSGRVGYVGYEFGERQSGRSKFSLVKPYYFVLNLLR